MAWLVPTACVAVPVTSCVAILAQSATTGQEIAPWIAAMSNVGLAGVAVWLIVVRGPQEQKERREDASAARKEYFDQLRLVQEQADRNRKESLLELRSYFDSLKSLIDEVQQITRETQAVAKDTQATSHEAKHMAANLYQSAIQRAALEEQRAKARNAGKSNT